MRVVAIASRVTAVSHGALATTRGTTRAQRVAEIARSLQVYLFILCGLAQPRGDLEFHGAR